MRASSYSSLIRGLRFCCAAAAALSLAAACSSTTTRQGFTPEPTEGPASDFGATAPPPEVDHYANDPPPRWCGPATGETPPPPPGGTEQCPDDKNKPGCACDTVGETAACWTGLRANRGLGICKDGVTTCTQISENARGWGPCEGQVLPTTGSTTGKLACKCFSEGQWKLDNVVPCTVPDPAGAYVVSTVIGASGKPECPPLVAGSPPKKPSTPWSASTLTVDCAGHYELCYEIKAGDAKAPKASDCSITKTCVTVDYTKPGAAQKLPVLPAWVSSNTSCANKWAQSGGYAEMTVKGLSVRCDAIDDGAGAPYVFNRVSYCPAKCADDPSLPECKVCAQGGSGEF